MSFVVSLTWLKRGIAKTPTKLKIDKEELEQILKSSKKKDKKKNKKKEKKTEELEEEVGLDETDDVTTKYELGDYDDEEEEGNGFRFNSIQNSFINTT